MDVSVEMSVPEGESPEFELKWYKHSLRYVLEVTHGQDYIAIPLPPYALRQLRSMLDTADRVRDAA
mgnify:CR=1